MPHFAMGEERIIPVPPLPRHREGEILNELANPAGLVLWQDVRHVRDWAESAPGQRAKLFSPASAEATAKRKEARASADELAGPLKTFAAMKVAPLDVKAANLGVACERVVDWALERDHTETAIEWAEVAALVDPENPRLANIAGRVTRNANLYDRSEVWFKRGLGLARAGDDLVEKVWGHLGYGRLCQELGRVACARRHLNRGSSLAWKEGPPSLAASAQHDLCAMLMVRGHLAEASKRAQRALRWYPKHHHRLPFFAADVGLMLILGGRFSSAARLLRFTLRHIEQPSARAAIIALTARAYSGADEREEAAVHRHRALRLLEKHRGMEPVARWHLADAHRLAADWAAAEAEAEQALALAVEKNDRETERLTRVLLGLIKRRTAAPGTSTAPDERLFIRQLVARLQEWSPRRGRQGPGPWGEDRVA